MHVLPKYSVGKKLRTWGFRTNSWRKACILKHFKGKISINSLFTSCLANVKVWSHWENVENCVYVDGTTQVILVHMVRELQNNSVQSTKTSTLLLPYIIYLNNKSNEITKREREKTKQNKCIALILCTFVYKIFTGLPLPPLPPQKRKRNRIYIIFATRIIALSIS